MIEYTEYEEKLNEIAEDFINNQRDTVRYLEKLLTEADPITGQLFEFRKFFLDKHDSEKVEGYLEIGFYRNKSKEDRIAFFCLEFELEAVIRRKRLINLCKRYNDNQTVFEKESELTDYIRIKGSKKGKPENELIDYTAFKQLNTSEIVKFNNSFIKLCPYLNSRIPEWASGNFSYSSLFVRINPDIISDERLPQLLTEELQINPYNIDWKSFKFSKNILTPQDYKLENIEISEEKKGEYWDYNIRKIKNLQVSTSKKENYRSFILEELIDRNSEEEILVGKCIHLDSKNFDESKLDTQILDHLDLAINIYEKENRKTRLSENLKNGKIIDADFRTHILRINNVPLKSLPVFCMLFFNSMTLTERYLLNIVSK